MALEKQQDIANEQSTRGAANPAPLFAFRTMRAKGHAAVSLNREEALRYLGYSGQAIDDGLVNRLESIAAACETELDPTFTWDEDPRVVLAGASLVFEGESVASHLRGARFAACFAATLGAESERQLRTLAAINPLDAMLYDACCNALIEEAAQAAQEDIAHEAASAGLFARMRFSPGYGDLPLAVQPQFIKAIDASRRLGLAVNESLLLVPAKSITAIVGLFDELPPATTKKPCKECVAREYCSYLEKGITCYGNHH